MKDKDDIALMAHLMRRAGFGAPLAELEERVAKGYEATVEELLNPEQQPENPHDVLQRYFVDWEEASSQATAQHYWLYLMVNTSRPLEEKITLFWHGIFCVGDAKCMHGKQIWLQLEKFRAKGLGSFASLLGDLAHDPAMLYFLDNHMSHKTALNENWGRELLELFSMGVGMDGHPNYTEDDVKACARAFTGWTVGNAIPRYPYGRYENYFFYNPEDHDDGDKTFLGETGPWDGTDVIEIICRKPATARFVARHLYSFFVADEPPVPSWQDTPPRDPDTIQQLEDEYFRSGYEIRSMLRVLFNSDAFKKAQFQRVKSPAEVVAGTLRLVRDFTSPKPGLAPIAQAIQYMGMSLLNPPTVEGWHTGVEWIDSGALVERVNFVADQVGNTDLPGVQDIVNRLGAQKPQSSEEFVDGLLELVGPVRVSDDTRQILVEEASRDGEIRNTTSEEHQLFTQRVGGMLQLIAAAPEYQFN